MEKEIDDLKKQLDAIRQKIRLAPSGDLAKLRKEFRAVDKQLNPSKYLKLYNKDNRGPEISTGSFIGSHLELIDVEKKTIKLGGINLGQAKIVEDCGDGKYIFKVLGDNHYPYTVYHAIHVIEGRIVSSWEGEFGRNKVDRIEGIKNLKSKIEAATLPKT